MQKNVFNIVFPGRCWFTRIRRFGPMRAFFIWSRNILFWIASGAYSYSEGGGVAYSPPPPPSEYAPYLIHQGHMPHGSTRLWTKSISTFWKGKNFLNSRGIVHIKYVFIDFATPNHKAKLHIFGVVVLNPCFFIIIIIIKFPLYKSSRFEIPDLKHPYRYLNITNICENCNFFLDLFFVLTDL